MTDQEYEKEIDELIDFLESTEEDSWETNISYDTDRYIERFKNIDELDDNRKFSFTFEKRDGVVETLTINKQGYLFYKSGYYYPLILNEEQIHRTKKIFEHLYLTFYKFSSKETMKCNKIMKKIKKNHM